MTQTSIKKRYHILFSGNVQGVGFRYTAQNLADKYTLSGWVMNLPNGKVEVELEGGVESFKEFCAEIQEIFRRYIDDIQIDESDYIGDYKDFRIRFV
ncbi:MAG: acylphosphatase [Candidatus Omnitrophica bacterium]|nr:acylphosphatase [Candidatus Omnitrophota bacterium]